jgi:ribonuclease P/MRP protein subunit RPP40
LHVSSSSSSIPSLLPPTNFLVSFFLQLFACASALNKKKYCIGLFLDLKKAFDECSHPILLKKLKKYGISAKAQNWFSSYLKDRKQKVHVNGTFSSVKTFYISVIQGSTLGPILFLIYINDIYNASSLAKFMFADDTACVASNANLDNLVECVNGEIKKIARWFCSNKMAVNWQDQIHYLPYKR